MIIIGIFRIIYIVCKYRLFKPDDVLGARLRAALIELGPIYIKFGQTISTSPAIVGERIAGELELLQDRLPPFSVEHVKTSIKNSFKAPIEDLFTSFDLSPVSAASVAQVHKAVTKNNEEVAVKILRPNIHQKYAQDIRLLYFIARFITKYFSRYKRLRLIRVVDIFKNTMEQELDLKIEAANASLLQDNHIKDKDVHIPKVYWNLTSHNVLTTEWINGFKIYDLTKIKEYNLNGKDLSAKIGLMFFNQAFRDGFFHADLHPGNIIIQKDGRIALVDFGIVGHLERRERLILAEILFKFFQRDYLSVAKLHLKAGYIPPYSDVNLFAQKCRAIYEPLIDISFQNIRVANLLSNLFKITEEFGMHTQPQLLLLQKTMIVIESIGRVLTPDTNMWQQTRPWITKWAAKNISPEAKLIQLIKLFIEDSL